MWKTSDAREDFHSTVSDSEAVVHLAHVQDLWQSKTLCKLRRVGQVVDGLGSEMQLARP